MRKRWGALLVELGTLLAAALLIHTLGGTLWWAVGGTAVLAIAGGLVLEAKARRVTALGKAVSVAWREEQFPSHLGAGSWSGNCIWVDYHSRLQDTSLDGCRLHLDSIRRAADGQSPQGFTAAYLRWDHGGEIHNLGPGEHIVARVVHHYLDSPVFVQAAAHATPLPYAIEPGTWDATITLRADGSVPLTSSVRFECEASPQGLQPILRLVHGQ
jgi:hypothetical protein